MSGALNSLERLAERADGTLDLIHNTLEEAMEAQKKAWVTCPHCKHRSEVDVTDTRNRIQASKVMSDRLEKVAELLARAKQQQGTAGPDWGILHGYPLETKEAAYQKLLAELTGTRTITVHKHQQA